MFRESTIRIIDIRDRDTDFTEEQIDQALVTEIKLLRKCLEDATEQRDEYKRQLDELNAIADRYIRQEYLIKNGTKERKTRR
jgi:hypothetical protein